MTPEERKKRLDDIQAMKAKNDTVLTKFNDQQQKVSQGVYSNTDNVSADNSNSNFSLTPSEAKYLNTLSAMGKEGDAKAKQYVFDKFSPDKVLARQKAQQAIDYANETNPYKAQNLQYTTGMNEKKYSSYDINQQIKQKQAELNYLNAQARADQYAANYDENGNYIGTPYQQSQAQSYGQTITPRNTGGSFYKNYQDYQNNQNTSNNQTYDFNDYQSADSSGLPSGTVVYIASTGEYYQVP